MAASKRRNKLIAKLVGDGDIKPCAFCLRQVDDEVVFGKLYAIGELQCHYFCVLLSCCLVQKGKDNDGLLGFLYPDILNELQRSKKHKCSYCGKGGATLGCTIAACRKQFHLPCGREKQAVSLFYDNYKSFCKDHVPKQNVPESIMTKAILRKREYNKRRRLNNGETSLQDNVAVLDESPETVCAICYESVEGFPSPITFWPPCCARDAWFHRTCVQRMALSAGMHYLKCPLCNDKENFYMAVTTQGYYVPDRDAAWELEQNAFAEIYERPVLCSAEDCACPMGRKYDSNTGPWNIALCLLCGSSGFHSGCSNSRVCQSCKPVAPEDLDQLESTIAALIQAEQAQEATNVRRGPVMPSRMSLRRTKQRNLESPSTSQEQNQQVSDKPDAKISSTLQSREDLGLKPPRRLNLVEFIQKNNIENFLLSPIKLLEQGVNEKLASVREGQQIEINTDIIVDRIRQKISKPKPLCVKKKIVNGILEEIFNNNLKDLKSKDPIKEWNSPKKLELPNLKEPLIEVKENKLPDTSPKKTESPKEKNKIETKETKASPLKLMFMTKSPTETKETKASPLKLMFMTKSPTNLEKILTTSPTEKLEHKQPEMGDESSTSTFELPSEFIANNSNDSIFETPKKLKTIDIKKDSSLEIFKNDEVINIDVVQMTPESENTDFMKKLKIISPIKSKCALKFCSKDKEKLSPRKIDIDLESFKNHYLNEVEKNNIARSNDSEKETKEPLKDLSTITESTDNIVIGSGTKRKIKYKENIQKKRRKMLSTNKKIRIIRKERVVREKDIEKIDISTKTHTIKQVIEETVLSVEGNNAIMDEGPNGILANKALKKRKFKKKHADKLVNFKIRFRDQKNKQKNKSRIKTVMPKKLTQYVLNYSSENKEDILSKPENDVFLKPRKYIRHDKSPKDKLVQTNLYSFLNIKYQ